MRISAGLTAWLVSVLLAIPGEAVAQWGPLMEKLQQLSGPAMRNWTLPNLWFGPYRSWQRLNDRDQQDLDSFTARIVRTETVDSCLTIIRRRFRPATDQRVNEGLVNEIRVISRNSRPDTLKNNQVCAAATQVSSVQSNPHPGRGWLFRLGPTYSRDDLGSGIWALTVRLSAEYRFQLLKNEVGLEAGVWPQRFAGGGIDPFFHVPLAGLFNFYPFAGCRSPVFRHARVGYGAALYYPFDRDDFAPAYPDLDEGWELIETWTFGLDITPRSFLNVDFVDFFRCD